MALVKSFTQQIIESYQHPVMYGKLREYLESIGEPELDKTHRLADLCKELRVNHDDLIHFLLDEAVDHQIGMHVMLNPEDKTVYFVKLRDSKGSPL